MSQARHIEIDVQLEVCRPSSVWDAFFVGYESGSEGRPRGRCVVSSHQDLYDEGYAQGLRAACRWEVCDA